MMEENSIKILPFHSYNFTPITIKKENTEQWDIIEEDTQFEWISEETTEGNLKIIKTFEGEEFYIKEEEYDIDEFFNDNLEEEVSEDVNELIETMNNDKATDIIEELSEFLYIPSSTSQNTIVNVDEDKNIIFNLSDQKKSFDAVLKSVQAQHHAAIVNSFSQITTEEVMLVDNIAREEPGETPKQVCGLCNRAFVKKSYLIQHINSKHSDKPFKCAKCSKKFVSQLKLDDHLQKHNFANKKWKCTSSGCNKAYAYKADLKVHQSNVHEKENKRFPCECGKSFTRKDHLKVHKRSHDNKLYKNILADVLTIK